MNRHAWMCALCALFLLVVLTSDAQVAEASSHPFLFSLSGVEGVMPKPPGHSEVFEDPCGLALDSHGDLYVSDYYHHAVDVIAPSHRYLTQIAAEDPVDGPCGLAVDAAGDVYVNNYHRNVVGFKPSGYPPGEETTYDAGTVIDSGHSTGVALDPATGDVYVDDGTYVAQYESSGGAPIAVIGLGSLGEGYGVAVSDFAASDGYVYVPDAATGTVKVFDPATSTITPVEGVDGQGTPQGGFDSLLDSAIAVDQPDGHIFVLDSLQSFDYEHPEATVNEFNAAGAYRGQLPQSPVLIDGEPSGLAVDDSGGAGQGDVYVTSGNSEAASLFAFGSTAPAYSLEVAKTGAGEGSVTSEPAGIECGGACTAEYDVGERVTLTAATGSGSTFVGWSVNGDAGVCPGTGACQVPLEQDTEVVASFAAAPEQTTTLQQAAAAGSAPDGELPGLVAGSSDGGLALHELNARGAAVTLAIVVNGPGTLSASGEGIRPTVVHRDEAGAVNLRLHLSRAGKRALARYRRLRVKVTVAFIPCDGRAAALAARVVTFRERER